MTIEWDKIQWQNTVQNDSAKAVSDVRAILEKDGVEIVYGDLALIVEKPALDYCRQKVAEMDQHIRHTTMIRLANQLQARVPGILKGKRFSKKRMDDLYHAMMLWTALKEAAAN